MKGLFFAQPLILFKCKGLCKKKLRNKMEEVDKIKLSNGKKAIVLKKTEAKYNNILIVELDGVLRVIDKETRTLAEPLGNIQNKHAYHVRKP